MKYFPRYLPNVNFKFQFEISFSHYIYYRYFVVVVIVRDRVSVFYVEDALKRDRLTLMTMDLKQSDFSKAGDDQKNSSEPSKAKKSLNSTILHLINSDESERDEQEERVKLKGDDDYQLNNSSKKHANSRDLENEAKTEEEPTKDINNKGTSNSFKESKS